MMIKIEQTKNGFLVTTDEQGSSVFQDNEDDPIKSAEDLLFSVIEYFNLGGTRYDEERLTVSRVPGDKFSEVEVENDRT